MFNSKLIGTNNAAGGGAGLSFNTLTYTGTGASRSITGVGFQPDWTWIKKRSSSTFSSHMLFDSVRGADKVIKTDSTQAEFNGEGTGYLPSFDSDGFSLTGNAIVNESGQTFVAWCWKAGGAAVSNTDGTITSQVSANTETGFSIVSYTGNGTQPSTIGHGLNATPDVVILKNRDISINWHVYHSAVMTGGDAKFLRLNTTDAILTDGADNVWDSGFNNQTFGVGIANNQLNNNIIAYCFAEVAGFSKFGSYTGTGIAGNFVSTSVDGDAGFEPAFIMLKRTDGTGGSWFMFDNKRNPSNPRLNYLKAQTSDAEASNTLGINFLSNGFDFNEVAFNDSGATFIYMAFANQF